MIQMVNFEVHTNLYDALMVAIDKLWAQNQEIKKKIKKDLQQKSSRNYLSLKSLVQKLIGNQFTDTAIRDRIEIIDFCFLIQK